MTNQPRVPAGTPEGGQFASGSGGGGGGGSTRNEAHLKRREQALSKKLSDPKQVAGLIAIERNMLEIGLKRHGGRAGALRSLIHMERTGTVPKGWPGGTRATGADKTAVKKWLLDITAVSPQRLGRAIRKRK